MVSSPFAATRTGNWQRAGWVLAAAIAVSGLWACRFGGGSTSLLDPVSPSEAPLRDAGEASQSSSDSAIQVEAGSVNTPLVDSGSMSTPSDAGSMETPAVDGGASGTTDASHPPDPDSSVGGERDAQAGNPNQAAAGSCGQTIAVCDPIRKTGCVKELQLQCDVDLLAATPTGVCVFYAPSADPNSCLNILPTESCPAGQTCVDAKCHTICLCDSDCEPNKCCNKPVGAGGLKVCVEC